MAASTIRAARLHDAGDLRCDSIPRSSPPENHVAIAPEFCGLCGSDLRFYFDHDAAKRLRKPHPLTGSVLPVTMGHEFAGVITDIGARCPGNLHTGDKVAVIPILVDGTCASCRSGATNTCRQIGFIGYNAPGGLAEQTIVPVEQVFKLPASMDCEIGALLEPLAVAWHAIDLAGTVSPSSKVAILGAGAIGCATLLCLRARGVTEITVSEPSEAKRRFASELGATAECDPLTRDLAQYLPGEGFDVVFDAAGAAASLNTALACVRPHGTVVNLAVTSKPVSLQLLPMTMKEATMKFSIGYYRSDFEAVAAAIEKGDLDPRRLVTKKIALDEVAEKGFQIMASPDNPNCKILVEITKTKM